MASAQWARRPGRCYWLKDRDHALLIFPEKFDMSEEKVRAVAAPFDSAWGRHVHYDDFIGNEFLRVAWPARHHVFDIMNAFLAAGYTFRVQARIDVFVRAGPVTPANLERAAIAETKKCEDQTPMMTEWILDRCPAVWRKESAWQTEEGKAFVRLMRQKYPMTERESDSEKEFESDNEVPVVPPMAAAVAVAEEVEGEEFVCSVCFTHPPDTIVYPCGHCVVCHQCSVQLRNTADKNRCIQCRQIIERIDEPCK